MTSWLRSPPGFTTSIGQNTTDSTDKQILSGGSTHTKGSYVEIVSSTAFDATAITLFIGQDHLYNDWLFDVAVGAASSEQIIISNFLWHNLYPSAYGIVSTPTFPISIPAGSRIAVRGQCYQASADVRVSAVLHHGGAFADDTFSLCHSMGPATADTGGVQLDPGGTANTKGSWSQIVASSEFDCEQVMVALSGRNNIINTTQVGLVDIGVGAAASEQVVIANQSYAVYSGTDMLFPRLGPLLPFHVPAGSRIAARNQCDITEANDRLIDIALYGFC